MLRRWSIAVLLLTFSVWTDASKSPSEAFSVATTSRCQSSAWVGTDDDPDAVFFATLEPDNLVYRISGSTGKVKWSVSMGPDRNGMRCSPIVSGKLLHIGTDNGTFTALDVDTGKRVWTYMPDKPTLCNDGGWMRPCEVYSSALLADGLRFQGSEDNHTRCFNATTGELLWEKPAAGNVDGTPVVGVLGSNSIWVGADDGFLYNLHITTGENVLPPVQHCGTMESQPATDPTKGVLFSMCRKPGWTPDSKNHDAKVFALDMHKGTFLWSIECTGGVPIYAAERNTIFVAGENGTAFAADATTGQLIWTQEHLGGARFMGPFAYDHGRGLLYGGNFAGIVCALNATSGKVVWTYRVQSAKHTPYIAVPLGPRISSDASLLYFGAYDQVFHALKLTD